MRVFATADLHADFHANRELVEGLSGSEFKADLLIAAGDIAHRLDLVTEVLEGLRARFARVFFVPGNHDLWVRGDEGDSVAKFHRLLARCGDLGVETEPARLADLRVVPLFSWYEPSLDGGGEVPPRWADRRHCRWPDGLNSPSEHFASLNEPYLQSLEREWAPVGALPPSRDAASSPRGTGTRCRGTVAGGCAPGEGQASLTLTCSHFVPRRDLLPPNEFLRYAGLPKVAGSPRLERQLRAAGADLHVFGHSHIRVDEVIDGVRYVQHSLGYPRERREPRSVVRRVV